jgi:hypothetical protein
LKDESASRLPPGLATSTGRHRLHSCTAHLPFYFILFLEFHDIEKIKESANDN